MKISLLTASQALAVAGASTTSGGMVTYCLFAPEDNKELIQKLEKDKEESRVKNAGLQEELKKIEDEKRKDNEDGFVSLFPLIKEVSTLNRRQKCYEDEIKEYKSLPWWDVTTAFVDCDEIK